MSVLLGVPGSPEPLPPNPGTGPGPGPDITPPTPVTPPRIVLRTPMRHTWIGWDGSTWDLTGRTATGVYFRPGVRGTNAAAVKPYRSDLAGVNGTQYRGHRLGPREVFWPISLWADGDSQAWIDYDAAFWRTLQPGRVGTWQVQQPNGDVRSLQLRFENDGGHAIDSDPAQMGWTQYGIYLTADQPLWEGPPIRPPAWDAGDTQPFFGGDAGGGLGPPYFISSGFTLANAVIDNPGDLDAWPVWTITGPTTSVSVGIAGRVVEVPFALAGGEQLVLNTHPTQQTAHVGPVPAPGVPFVGVERTRDLGQTDFAPIPNGESRPLSLNMVGDGTVQAQIVPLYNRAHG